MGLKYVVDGAASLDFIRALLSCRPRTQDMTKAATARTRAVAVIYGVRRRKPDLGSRRSCWCYILIFRIMLA